MKNKTIIMSFLLILLIAISASATSAADATTNDQTVISSDDGIITEEINKDTTDKSLSDGGININNNWIVKPSSDGSSDAASIQKCIESSASSGDTVKLGDYNFTLEKPVTLSKDITVNGGTIYNTNNLSNMFIITPISEKGPSSITFTGSTFYVTGNEDIIYAKGDIIGNGITQVANITMSNCKIIPITQDANISNTKLVKVESDNTSTLTTGTLSIQNNNYGGAQSLNINNALNFTDNTFYKVNIILDTVIEVNNMSTYAYDKNTDPAKYLDIKLLDANGNPVANQTLSIAGPSGKVEIITDENGIGKYQITFTESTPLYISYLGEAGRYNGADMAVSIITVTKKTPSITVKTYTYNVNAKSKKISVTIKDQSNRLVVKKAVKITVNGKTYTTQTNSKGVATVTVSISKKGTYTYTAKVTSNSIYKEVSKKGKLVINGLSSALTLKKYTFKRYATKKIKVTLKSGKTVLKSKKITLKINGKTYSAKTNSKGVATVSIKLTKKGTFTYTVKFAGDNTYKATSKSAKAVIK